MKALVVLPLVVPLATAVACIFAWRARRVQRIVSLAGGAVLAVSTIALVAGVFRAGPIVSHVGSWPAPFGITLVADPLSALMLLLPGVLGPLILAHGLSRRGTSLEAHGVHPLVHTLLLGVSGAFLAGDLFNLFVWFEVLLIASFTLLCLEGGRAQMEGGIKYVTLNLVSSALFLTTVGLLYGTVGTLNMADLHERLASAETQALTRPLAMLLLVAFGIKAALFPFSFWLPASYHTPRPWIAALFSALLTKVGIYAMLRTFTLIFPPDRGMPQTLLLVLACLTMVLGVVGAATQNEFRRILAFHSVSQVGYMAFGLALHSTLAVAGSILFMLHHAVVKSNLFLMSGIVEEQCGTSRLQGGGGIYRERPGLALLFWIPALSLAGIPPLSGFFAKLTLVQAGLADRYYAVIAVALAVSLVTLFSMVKIWSEMFLKPQPDSAVSGTRIPPGALRLAVPVLLALGAVAMGVFAGPLVDAATRAAEQLATPEVYVRAVLGGAR